MLSFAMRPPVLALSAAFSAKFLALSPAFPAKSLTSPAACPSVDRIFSFSSLKPILYSSFSNMPRFGSYSDFAHGCVS